MLEVSASVCCVKLVFCSHNRIAGVQSVPYYSTSFAVSRSFIFGSLFCTKSHGVDVLYHLRPDYTRACRSTFLSITRMAVIKMIIQ